MQTTVILFQTPKLGNITRIIYYKNLNSWELFEIIYVNKKSVLIFSQFVTNIGKLIVVLFIVNKEPTVYR